MRYLAAAIVFLMCAGPATAGEGPLTDEQRAELSRHFGFGELEIYKFEYGVGRMRLADLNSDGRTDIIAWNPRKARIELLYQPDADKQPAADRQELEQNEIPNRGNLRIEHLPVAYDIATLEVADLTGDKLPDIVFFGEPKEVVIMPGMAGGGFGAADGLRAPDGDARGGTLAIGDFNHDGRNDVALLGPKVLQIFHQKAGGGLAQPVRIVHNIEQPIIMIAADVNGDGRDDLAISTDDRQYAINVILQEPDGVLGPLRRIKVPNVRSMTFAPAAGGDDLFAVETTTGRLIHYRWEAPAETATESDWAALSLLLPGREQE